VQDYYIIGPVILDHVGIIRARRGIWVVKALPLKGGISKEEDIQ